MAEILDNIEDIAKKYALPFLGIPRATPPILDPNRAPSIPVASTAAPAQAATPPAGSGGSAGQIQPTSTMKAATLDPAAIQSAPVAPVALPNRADPQYNQKRPTTFGNVVKAAGLGLLGSPEEAIQWWNQPRTEGDERYKEAVASSEAQQRNATGAAQATEAGAATALDEARLKELGNPKVIGEPKADADNNMFQEVQMSDGSVKTVPLGKQAAPTSDSEKEVSDYLKGHGLPNDAAHRDVARQAIKVSDARAVTAANLPLQEQKMKFDKDLALTQSQVELAGHDQQQRAMKADELQMAEDKRHDNVSTSIDFAKKNLAASDSNQVAAATVPTIQTLITVSTVGNVHRVNGFELERNDPKYGSALRWWEANYDKIAAGKLPADYKKNVSDILDMLSKSEKDQHEQNGTSIDKNIRTGGGSKTTAPAGKTVFHYDAQGNRQ